MHVATIIDVSISAFIISSLKGRRCPIGVPSEPLVPNVTGCVATTPGREPRVLFLFDAYAFACVGCLLLSFAQAVSAPTHTSLCPREGLNEPCEGSNKLSAARLMPPYDEDWVSHRCLPLSPSLSHQASTKDWFLHSLPSWQMP